MTSTLFSCGGMRHGKTHLYDDLDKEDMEQSVSKNNRGGQDNNKNSFDVGSNSTMNKNTASGSNSTSNNSKVA